MNDSYRKGRTIVLIRFLLLVALIGLVTIPTSGQTVGAIQGTVASQASAVPTTITIRIDGVEYERPRPKTYAEAVALLDGIVKMYNDLDTSFVEYKAKVKEEFVEVDKLTVVSDKLALAESELTTVKKDLQDYKDAFTENAKTNTEFTVFGTVGPILSTDGAHGASAGIISEYRFLRNFHLGLNLNLNVYTISRIDGSLGLVLGYSIY